MILHKMSILKCQLANRWRLATSWVWTAVHPPVPQPSPGPDKKSMTMPSPQTPSPPGSPPSDRQSITAETSVPLLKSAEQPLL